MKYRKVIGWLLFALGIPYLLIALAVTGEYSLHIFITFLVMGGGWILAHPKRKMKNPS